MCQYLPPVRQQLLYPQYLPQYTAYITFSNIVSSNSNKHNTEKFYLSTFFSVMFWRFFLTFINMYLFLEKQFFLFENMSLQYDWYAYQFPRVTIKIITSSWLKTTESYSLTVLEARNPNSRSRKGHILSKGSKGKSFLSLPRWLLVTYLSCRMSHICLQQHVAFCPLCVSSESMPKLPFPFSYETALIGVTQVILLT